METYQLALIAVRVLMAHSPSVAPDGKGHRFFEPCYRRVLCPIHNSLLKVVPSSSVHFEAPRFGNARCLPHIESFFFGKQAFRLTVPWNAIFGTQPSSRPMKKGQSNNVWNFCETSDPLGSMGRTALLPT